jgi:hypothetical protein
MTASASRHAQAGARLPLRLEGVGRRARAALREMREERDMTDPPPDTVAALTVPALLSVATVARILDCSPQTVRRRIAAGELAAVTEHGRLMVRGDDLRAYIDGLKSATALRVGAAGPSCRADEDEWDFLR